MALDEWEVAENPVLRDPAVILAEYTVASAMIATSYSSGSETTTPPLRCGPNDIFC